MKPLRFILVAVLCLAPWVARAQSNPNSGPPDPGVAPPDPVVAQQSQPEMPPPPPPGRPVARREMRGGGPGGMGDEPMGGREFGGGLGAWWKNSDVVARLQLSQEQVKKISQTFLDHRLNLVDLRADVEKQELRMQPLLDVDQPDQTKVGAQIDLITAARGRLEKENAMMMLDIRRLLSVEQWKKLESLHAEEPGDQKTFYKQKNKWRGGPEGNMEAPPPPPSNGDTPLMKPPAVRPPQ